MKELWNPEFAAALFARGKDNSKGFRTAHPYPHICFDDFLPVDPLERVLEAYPTDAAMGWGEHQDETAKKRYFREVELWLEPIREVKRGFVLLGVIEQTRVEHGVVDEATVATVAELDVGLARPSRGCGRLVQ